MKRLRYLFFFALFFSGCAKTEVLNVSVPQLDTIATKAHRPPKPPRDTTERQDTARVPIEFDASVEDWNKTNVDL